MNLEFRTEPELIRWDILATMRMPEMFPVTAPVELPALECAL